MNLNDSTNLQVARQKSERTHSDFLSRLVASVTGPMTISAGPGLPSVEGLPGRAVTGDDPTLLEKTKSVRGRGERLIQLMARTGIGLAQLRSFSVREIEHFVDTVSKNIDYQEAVEVQQKFEPRKPQSRFVIFT